MSIGQALSAARRDAGLSIDDISAKTRLRATVIRSIEADDFSLCGGDFYARGHIRTLAGLVGLDPAPLLAEYDATVGGGDDGPATSQIYENEATGRAITRTAQKRSPRWGLAAVATTPGRDHHFRRLSGCSTTTAKTTPPVQIAAGITTPPRDVAEPEPDRVDAVSSRRHPRRRRRKRRSSLPGSAVAEAGVHVVLRITTTKCWVEATGSNGPTDVLYQGVLSPGAIQTFDDPQRVSLRLGNAPATDITVNGVDLGAPATKNSVTSVSFGPGNPLLAQG